MEQVVLEREHGGEDESELRNFVRALRTTVTNCRVSFIDLYLVFPRNFRIIFLPNTNTVILLEPYCGTITEPGLHVVTRNFNCKETHACDICNLKRLQYLGNVRKTLSSNETMSLRIRVQTVVIILNRNSDIIHE